MKPESLEEKKLRDEWRKGFEAGTKAILRERDVALRIGQAILLALDDRYEFRKEDY